MIMQLKFCTDSHAMLTNHVIPNQMIACNLMSKSSSIYVLFCRFQDPAVWTHTCVTVILKEDNC